MITSPYLSPSTYKKAVLSVCLGSSILLFGGLSAQASLKQNFSHTPQADAVAVIDTTSNHWEFLTQKEPFATGIRDFQAEISGDIAKELGLDLEKELLPMIGSHINFAFYAKDSIPVLMVVDLKANSPVANQAYARLIQKLEEKSSQDDRKNLRQINWENHIIYGFERTTHTVKKNKEWVYMARTLNKETLVIGSLARVKEGLTQKNNLLSNKRFAPFYERLKQHKFWFYGTPPSLIQSMQAQKINTKELKETFADYKEIGIGFDVNPQGLLARSIVTLPPGPALTAIRAASETPKAIRKTAPPHVMLFASGSDLKTLLPQSKSAEKDFKALTGLDFRKDLLNPSDGHMGLSIFYPADTRDYDRPPQFVLSIGGKNHEVLKNALTRKLKLDFNALMPKRKIAKEDTVIRFISKPVTKYRGIPIFKARNNQMLNNLQQSLFVDPAIARVNNLWLIASNMEAIKHSIDQSQGRIQNLNSNRYLSQLQSLHSIDPQLGLIFVDLRNLGDMLEFVAGEDDEVQAIKPSLSAFRSLLIGSSQTENRLETLAVMDIHWQKVDFKMLRKMR